MASSELLCTCPHSSGPLAHRAFNPDGAPALAGGIPRPPRGCCCAGGGGGVFQGATGAATEPESSLACCQPGGERFTHTSLLSPPTHTADNSSAHVLGSAERYINRPFPGARSCAWRLAASMEAARVSYGAASRAVLLAELPLLRGLRPQTPSTFFPRPRGAKCPVHSPKQRLCNLLKSISQEP